MAEIKQINVDNQEQENNVLKVGQILARARQKKRKEIKRIAEQLCIRQSYLEALENSQYDVFPGQFYAVGFLKTYANYLNLNANELIDLYRKETDFLDPKPVIMPIPEKSSMMPSVSYILAGVFILAVVWGSWFFLSYQNTPKNAPLPEPVEIKTDMVPVPDEVILSPDEAIMEPVPETSETETTLAEQTSSQLSADDTARIKIIANQDVWLEIQDEDMFIFNRILKKGEVFEVPNESENMVLKTGNAGGMDIYVDGEKIKPLGPVGSVRTQVKLVPDVLKNR